ncbi:galactose-1-phosphate uridylyltransferase [Pseudonocardia asaccharolytica]|uniref:galactose-1-phosphate uridylyltransferase n=1 Tax=Pseudonocardia asaccharolytica TaxID=54010 RepID=UPI00048B7100|nr:galactose-1-phosphate uridylyltransferase [Pseudonocardia asaccharolytica]
MKRTEGVLSDGRRIIWFDESDDAVRDGIDRRPLPRVALASQLRFDPLLGEWTAIATHRQDRTFLPSAAECPLCPTIPGRHTEIPTPDYDVVVFENRFSAFGGGPDARGRCEIVCFTSDHSSSFGALTPARARLVVDVWADRTAQLGELPGVRHVFPFENRGADIGVTLHHPHGQIYAYPYVSPLPARMLAMARTHAAATGRNLFADVLAAEREAGERVVLAGRYWTAFVPRAARWPVEVHLYPHRRMPDLPALRYAERDEFAELYLDLLGRLDALYDDPLPYVAAWQQAPARPDSDGDRDLSHLHLRVFSIRRAPGKLKYLAGSESGAGAFINDVLPEAVAQRLRTA